MGIPHKKNIKLLLKIFNIYCTIKKKLNLKKTRVQFLLQILRDFNLIFKNYISLKR